MPARARLTLLVATTCLVVALGAAVVLGGGGGGASGGAAAGAFEGALRPPSARAVDFRLHDQAGRLATMRAYRGRTVIVTFMYATCEDTCPLTTQQIRGALDALGRAVPVLAISVDPAGDTPARVRRFLREQRMERRMRYLTGTSAQLAPVWRAYGIRPQSVEREHTASTVVVDGAGRQRLGYLTAQLTPEGLAGDLRRLGAGARAAR